MVVLFINRLYHKSPAHIYVLDIVELALVFTAFFLLRSIATQLVISATLIFTATRFPLKSSFHFAQNSTLVAEYIFLFAACIVHTEAHIPALLFDVACVYRTYVTCSKAA